MTLETPYFLGAIGGDAAIEYSAREMRLPLDAAFATEGVCGIGHFAVTQRAAGANQSVDIAPGIVVVSGDVGTFQGKYLLRNNAVVNFPLTVGLPVSGTRRHVLVVRVNDKQIGASTYTPDFFLVQDAIGAGALPAIPSNSCRLAEIRRTAGQAGGTSVLTASIVDARPLATGLEGPSRMGWFYVVTDVNGYATVPLPPNLGFVPSMIVPGTMARVLGGPGSVVPGMIVVDQTSITAVNFRVRVWSTAGALYANREVFITWAAHS